MPCLTDSRIVRRDLNLVLVSNRHVTLYLGRYKC